MNMNMEEYRTLRDEMLQRFRWTRQLLLFSVGTTAALLSWLFTKGGDDGLNPILFVFVGLGLISFLFYSYKGVLEQIYHIGGYLAIFHEGGADGLKFHRISRLGDDLLGEKAQWGKDPRRGVSLLFLLTIANCVGPFYIVKESGKWPALDEVTILSIAGAVIFMLIIISTGWGLWSMKKSIRKDMSKWLRLKEKLETEPSVLERIIDDIREKPEAKPSIVEKIIKSVLKRT